MKASVLSVLTISLFQLASAQPHRRHAHPVEHIKKDVVTVVETYIAEATAVPNVVVYVNQKGQAVETATEAITADKTYKLEASTSTPSSTPTPSSSTVTSSPSAPAAPAAANGFGLAYSPFNRDKSCKTIDQIRSDFTQFGDYGLIRTYGVECDTIANVYQVCKETGKKLFAGVFYLDGLSDEINNIIAGVNGDWGSIYAINVGNELVDSGSAAVQDVVDAIGTARGLLRGAGYSGPVVTVDTAAAVLDGNHALCDASDFCAINAHPFFDSTVSSGNAGQWLTDTITAVRAQLANPSQTIIITETGWPSNGWSSNGAAVPSPADQESAISSIKSKFATNPSGVILLSAFNRQWLGDADQGAFGQEFWFGIMGDCPSG